MFTRTRFRFVIFSVPFRNSSGRKWSILITGLMSGYKLRILWREKHFFSWNIIITHFKNSIYDNNYIFTGLLTYMLRLCSETVGLPAIQQWVYQPKNKTPNLFLNVFVHFLWKPRFGNIITKIIKARRISKYMFFFLQCATGNSRLTRGCVKQALLIL